MPLVVLHCSKDIVEWSHKVKQKYFGFCGWPGCSEKGIGAAHIFPRGVMSLRLVVENGVWGCLKHHRAFDRMCSKKRFAMARLLVGKDVFEVLYKISKSKKSKVLSLLRGDYVL